MNLFGLSDNSIMYVVIFAVLIFVYFSDKYKL